VDGDGDADLAVTNASSNTLSILKNNGDGTFAAKEDYATGTNPRSVSVSDVDGDGDADLVVPNGNSNTVGILKNNGDGTFTARVDYPAASFPASVSVSDLDGDGDADLAVANSYSNTVSIFMGLNEQKVLAVSPPPHATGVGSGTAVEVTFSVGMNVGSFVDTSTFIVTGLTSGRHTGSFGFTGGNTVVTFTPDVTFTPGEIVVVDITSGIEDALTAPTAPFICTFTVAFDSTTGSLGSRNDYATGAQPQFVSVSDVDADGDADLAVGNAGSNSVSILKNNGNGTFGAKVDYPAGTNPSSVSMVDVDGDNDADLVVSNAGSNSVSVLKNDGTGAFAAKVDYATGTDPRSVSVSDVDGDGDGDLVVANSGSNSVSILKNNGSGSFGARVDYATGTNPRSLTLSDVNGDGYSDLIIANNGSDSVSILIYNIDGTFAAKVDYPTGTAPSSVAAGDVDGDGDADLAVANAGSNNVSILKNNGDGTFAARVDYPAGNSPSSLSVSDVNGDGHGDLVIANSGSDSVSILKNNANGTFAVRVDYATGSVPQSVFGADLDGDGDADLAVANNGSNTISILKGLGWVTGVSPAQHAIGVEANTAIEVAFGATMDTGSFLDTASFIVTGLYSGRHAGSFSFGGGNTFATFTSDAAFAPGEIVVVDVSSGLKDASNDPILPFVFTFTVASNPSAGTFTDRTERPAGNSPASATVNDIDRDGDGDILVANSGSQTLSLLRNNGGGLFDPKADHPTGSQPVSVVTGDFDGDGLEDVAVANYAADSLSILLNSGAGNFLAKVDYGSGNNPVAVATGDVDGDGDLDVAVANQGSSTISVFLNDGNGVLASKVDYATGAGPRSLKLTDLDNDGRLDMVSANSTDATVSVLLNQGDGTFGSKVDYPTGTNPHAVAMGDLNADGFADLVVANYGANTVSVLLNNGDGTFSAKTDFATGSLPVAVAVSDLNGDGTEDLATANLTSNTVSVLMGSGGGGFDSKTDYPGGAWPSSIVSADMDGDGDGDLVVGNSSSASISVLWNGAIVLPGAPEITDIADIAGDQGGQVRLKWSRSVYDTASATPPITSYGVFRKGSSGMFAKALPVPAGIAADSSLLGYDFVISVPALGLPTYQTVVATLADSSGSGIPWHTFRIVALTSVPEVYYTSQPDSGYSVDNLAPAPPANLLASVAPGPEVTITWDEVPDPDVGYYDIYRSTSGGFDPGAGNKVGTSTTASFTDESPVIGVPSYYKVISVDLHDNRSAPSEGVTVGVSGDQFFNVQARWNIVSVPRMVEDYTTTLLFPSAATPAYSFNGGYSMVSTLENGRGYWMKFSGGETISQSGLERAEATVPVQEGWNIVGSLSSSVAVSTIGSIPGGIVTSNFYRYDGSYVSSTSLEPGMGYWVKVSQAGQLTMSSTVANPPSNRIRIEDSGELPPPPPDGVLSAVPGDFSLEQNYPNPFNPGTRINYALPADGHVRLVVYNMVGQEVAVLVDEKQEVGYHSFPFDAGNLPSGVYTYRITAGSFSDARKMLLLK